jgi:hypothetical protein
MLHVVLILIAVGVLLWLVNTYGTMIDPKLKRIINIFVVVCVVIWLLSVFGVWSLMDVPVPRLHH